MKRKVVIRPNDNWHWYFDRKYDCLMLEIANDMVFRSRYPSKMLTPDAFNSFSFSVDHASAYYHFYENCTQFYLSEPQRVELVSNAIVAANFLKPQMPKSWYFVQQPMFFTPTYGEIVEAQVQDSNQRINLLVVEPSDTASLCLITDTRVTMAGKEFTLADVVKVMNDRLSAKHRSHANEKMSEEEVMRLFYQQVSS